MKKLFFLLSLCKQPASHRLINFLCVCVHAVFALTHLCRMTPPQGAWQRSLTDDSLEYHSAEWKMGGREQKVRGVGGGVDFGNPLARARYQTKQARLCPFQRLMRGHSYKNLDQRESAHIQIQPHTRINTRKQKDLGKHSGYKTEPGHKTPQPITDALSIFIISTCFSVMRNFTAKPLVLNKSQLKN